MASQWMSASQNCASLVIEDCPVASKHISVYSINMPPDIATALTVVRRISLADRSHS